MLEVCGVERVNFWFWLWAVEVQGRGDGYLILGGASAERSIRELGVG